MTVRTVRILTGAYFALYAVAVTYPGMLPFNRIRPLVLGLPFSIFWVALWVALSVVPLGLLYHVERRARGEG